MNSLKHAGKRKERRAVGRTGNRQEDMESERYSTDVHIIACNYSIFHLLFLRQIKVLKCASHHYFIKACHSSNHMVHNKKSY